MRPSFEKLCVLVLLSNIEKTASNSLSAMRDLLRNKESNRSLSEGLKLEGHLLVEERRLVFISASRAKGYP